MAITLEKFCTLSTCRLPPQWLEDLQPAASTGICITQNLTTQDPVESSKSCTKHRKLVLTCDDNGVRGLEGLPFSYFGSLFLILLAAEVCLTCYVQVAGRSNNNVMWEALREQLGPVATSRSCACVVSVYTAPWGKLILSCATIASSPVQPGTKILKSKSRFTCIGLKIAIKQCQREIT